MCVTVYLTCAGEDAVRAWQLTLHVQVKVLYVRNLTQLTTEEMIKAAFEEFGTVERVKKIKDYAFVHYDDREDAVKVRQD